MNPNQNVNDSELNQSNILANYKQQLGQYYQLMIDAFDEIDQNKDSYLDQKELLQFLDSKMPNGKIFDRSLFKKIFESIDTDLNGKISIKHEELKVHQEDLKAKVDAEREAMEKYQKLMFENKNEIVNSKNISKDAKLIVEIDSLRPVSITQNILRAIRTIKVRLDLDENSVSTSGRSINNLIFGEKFEFPITNVDDVLLVEAAADGGLCRGVSLIPLSTITDQNEKILELELNSENDDKNIVWLLNLKIILITSYYRLYQDNYFKAERRYAQNLAALEKINVGLETLSEPFNFLSKQGDNILNISDSKSNYGSVGKIDQIQFQMADKVENLVKNSLNTNDIHWIKIIHSLLLILLLISIFNMFLRSDFIAFLVVLYALVSYYTSFNTKTAEDLKIFIIGFSSCVVYDFFYMIFSPVFAHYSFEGSLKNLGGLITIIGFLLKIVLVLCCWIVKLKLRRNKKKSNKTKEPNINV